MASGWVGIVVGYIMAGVAIVWGLTIVTNRRGYGFKYYDFYFIDFFGYYRRRGFPAFQRWVGGGSIFWGSTVLIALTVVLFTR
jgi:hypothetical protein